MKTELQTKMDELLFQEQLTVSETATTINELKLMFEKKKNEVKAETKIKLNEIKQEKKKLLKVAKLLEVELETEIFSENQTETGGNE